MTIVDVFNKILEFLKNVFVPDQAASWQTFIGLSLLSWITSYLIILPLEALITQISPEVGQTLSWTPVEFPVENIVSTLGWIFLIIGVWWLTYVEKPINYKKSLTFEGFFIGPWIVGALICTFIFGEWDTHPPSLPYITWPIVSVIVDSLPDFIKPGPAPKVPEPHIRQKVIIVALSNLLLSCWFQLYFSLQAVLVDYPSMMGDDFRRSTFVVNLDRQVQGSSRGVTILNLAEELLKNQLEGQSWSDIERWLLQISPSDAGQGNPEQEQVNVLENPVLQGLSTTEENQLWHLRAQAFQGNPGYELRLFAIWQGPSSNPFGYYLTKSCQIMPSVGRTIAPTSNAPAAPTVTNAAPSATIGTVQCDTASPPIYEPLKLPTSIWSHRVE